MGRRKGSQTGVYSHGTMRRWKDGCRCETCAEGHEKHLEWSREYQRNYKTHGLSAQERQALKAKGCWACGSHFQLAIDHDHACCPGRFSCGECVRGVLCSPCNRILGYAKDDPEILLRLAGYLEDNAMTERLAEVTHIWGAASSGS